MDKQITLDDFCILKLISKGGFGEIVLAHKRTDHDVLYAIKQVKKSEMIKKNLLQQVQAERDALAISKSPFIVKIFYSFMSEGGIVNLVMEYMPGGDLKSLLSQMGIFQLKQTILYIAEMAHAINYLHSRGVIHRDVKPDNMLISLSGHLKLTDFGLCSVCHPAGHRTSLQISDVIMSPYTGNCVDKWRTPGQVLSLTSHLLNSASHASDAVCQSALPAASRVNRRVSAGAICNPMCRLRRSVPSVTSMASACSSTETEDDVTPVQIPRTRSKWMSIAEEQSGCTDEPSSVRLNEVFSEDEGQASLALATSSPKEMVRGGSSCLLDDSWDELMGRSKSNSSLVLTRKRSIHDMTVGTLATGITMNMEDINLLDQAHATSNSSNKKRDFTKVEDALNVAFSTPKKFDSSDVQPPIVNIEPLRTRDSSQFTTPCSSANVRLGVCTPYRAPMSSARRRQRGQNRMSLPNRERVLGTPFYMAPESFIIGEYSGPIMISPAVDWWALGVCLFEFTTGYLPFNGDDLHEIFTQIKLAHIDWPDTDPDGSGDEEILSSEQISAISALLKPDPEKRAMMDELKSLAMFSHMDFDNLLQVEPLFKPALDDPTDTYYFTYRNTVLLPNIQLM